MHLVINTKFPLVQQEMRFVGTNVIWRVANILEDLVISALKEKPVEMR